MKFRQILFWIHLAMGISAGVVIGIMAFTGTAIAFDKKIVAWAERDLRFVPSSSTNKSRVSIEEALRQVTDLNGETRPSSFTVRNDPLATIAVVAGRTDGYYVDPYTGTAQPQRNGGWRQFMRVMTDWHRWLGREGDSRPTG